jgi:lipooligosaccharide transport system permease protein
MSTATGAPARAASALRITPLPRASTAGWRMVERNFLVYRRVWPVFVSGFLEPVFYLFSIGIGVGALIGSFQVGGKVVGYADFVAPAMMAASAMNGAIIDATFNLFFRLKYVKLYDAILATPMRPIDVASGELTWCLLRGSTYSAAFLVLMAALGYLHSWWAVLAWPVTVLLGFAFGGAGMALTTFMRSWQDFQWVQLAILPMFLFSATFFPLDHYAPGLRWVVRATPLYQGVDLVRSLCLGNVTWSLLVPLVYLLAMGSLGLTIASRRLGILLLH